MANTTGSSNYSATTLSTGNLTNSTGNDTACGLSIVPEGQSDVFTYVALTCVVISSLSTTFGLFWQKAAQEFFSKAKHEYHVPKSKKLKCRGMGLWVLGFLCITLISFGLDLFSLSVLGQSVVVPLLASLEIAENQIFAPCMVHEVCVKRYDITATVFIIVGAVLTTIFGPAGAEVCSIEAIVELFSKVPFLVFQGVVVVLLIFSLSLMWSKAKCVDSFRFMLFAFVAGTLGGQQNLFLKGIGVLVGFAFAGENTFGEWQIWVFLLAMVTLAVLQLVILNMGLAKFEALQFIPAFTVLYILTGTMVGLIFYEEYQAMEALSWGMFSLGIAFIVAALVILGQKKSHETDTHSTEVDENGNPVLIRQKSFSPMLVSGAALEHLKHLARPLHNRIMLLRAFRRAHSMTSISHTSQHKVAPAAGVGVEMVPLKRPGKRNMKPQRSFSVDHVHKVAQTEVEVSAEDIAAAQGHVATARKRKQLETVFSSTDLSRSDSDEADAALSISNTASPAGAAPGGEGKFPSHGESKAQTPCAAGGAVPESKSERAKKKRVSPLKGGPGGRGGSGGGDAEEASESKQRSRSPSPAESKEGKHRVNDDVDATTQSTKSE